MNFKLKIIKEKLPDFGFIEIKEEKIFFPFYFSVNQKKYKVLCPMDRTSNVCRVVRMSYNKPEIFTNSLSSIILNIERKIYTLFKEPLPEDIPVELIKYKLHLNEIQAYLQENY